MIKVECDFCYDPLNKPGGLIFSPPSGNMVTKHHVCNQCFHEIYLKMKQCKECKVVKEKNNFYGVQGECKECTKQRVKLREQNLRLDKDWHEKEKQRHREKYHLMLHLVKVFFINFTI